jgi:TPR repeat protein
VARRRPLGGFLALGLGALALSSPADAGGLTAGERAYARHDYVRAAPLLLVAAQNGSPAAQTYLGYMYQTGRGVPRDYVAAAAWLQLAAEQGEPTAQFLLGLLFDKGYGVPQDWVHAEVWLNLAASRAPANQRDYWVRIRDAVAQKLTLDQLADAQRSALAWAPVFSGARPATHD